MVLSSEWLTPLSVIQTGRTVNGVQVRDSATMTELAPQSRNDSGRLTMFRSPRFEPTMLPQFRTIPYRKMWTRQSA